MLRFLILRKLASVECEIGISVDYVRHILRVSLGAFFKFAKVFPLAQYRRSLPLDMHVVAGIVAARDEDCGTCVQVALNMGKKQGVDSAILRAVIDREPERLPESIYPLLRVTCLGDSPTSAMVEFRSPWPRRCAAVQSAWNPG